MFYKDVKPSDTVKKINDILHKLDISLNINNYLNPVENCHSFRLIPENYPVIGTNGKGTTYDYASASAYAEFMERLQNLQLYSLEDIDIELKKHGNFLFYPDEKYFTAKDLIDDTRLIKYFFNHISHRSDRLILLESLERLNPITNEKDIICVPFYDIDNNPIYTPIDLIKICYGSNGMCAGNSYEEAISQGICEIIERFVNFEIIEKKLNPISINLDEIKIYKNSYSIINELISRGYDITVKDCSLDKEYPVVCVIIINKSTQCYTVKFGCHPVFEYALERTLTELLQGNNLNKLTQLVPAVATNEVINSLNNKENIFINGKGFYPPDLFLSNFSFKNRSNFSTNNIYYNSSKEILDYLLKVLSKCNSSILIRNVSFLGFPSYHVIIPGMSEITNINLDEINIYHNYIKFNNIIKNLSIASSEELIELGAYIESLNLTSNASLGNLLLNKRTPKFPWYSIKIDLLLCLIYYSLGDFDKSYKYSTQFINYLDDKINDSQKNSHIFLYYKCLNNFTLLKRSGFTLSSIIEILSKFYNLELVNEVNNFLGGNLFKDFSSLNCWNCSECNFSNYCDYNVLSKIHKSVKDEFLKHSL